MDYKAKIKERMSKLLFLEMNKDGFKENIGIPSYVTFKNKDLYLPISSEYISSNINDEIKIKNLPIYYFIEGMYIAIGGQPEFENQFLGGQIVMDIFYKSINTDLEYNLYLSNSDEVPFEENEDFKAKFNRDVDEYIKKIKENNN